MGNFSFWCLLFLMLQSPSAFAKKELLFVSTHWKEFTNHDGTGGYWEILDKSLANRGYFISKKNMPWKRAMKMAKDGQADGIVGTYKEANGLIYPKYHIDTDSVDVVYKPSRFPNYQNLQDMNGKKIEWRRGYSSDFKGHFKFKFQLSEFNSLESALKKLSIDRSDFVIDYRNDINEAIKKANLDKNNFKIQVAFRGDHVFIAFANSKQAEQLAKDFDAGFKALKDSGELFEIYKNWGWDMTFLPYQDLKTKTVKSKTDSPSQP